MRRLVIALQVGFISTILALFCTSAAFASTLNGVMESYVDWDALEDASGGSTSTLSLSLEENAVNENGVVLDTMTTSNEYALYPGCTCHMNPTVTVSAGSSPCYLFLYVEGDLSGIEGFPTVEEQIVANGWVPVVEMPGLYQYQSLVCAEKTAVVLPIHSSFNIREDLSISDVQAESNYISYTVYGYALGLGEPAVSSSAKSSADSLPTMGDSGKIYIALILLAFIATIAALLAVFAIRQNREK